MRVYCPHNLYEKFNFMQKLDVNQKWIWHAVMFHFDGDEYVLFTEDNTKFSICMPKMTWYDYANVELKFIAEFMLTLRLHGYGFGMNVYDFIGCICCVESDGAHDVFEYQGMAVQKLLFLMRQPECVLDRTWFSFQLNENVDCQYDWREHLEQLGVIQKINSLDV